MPVWDMPVWEPRYAGVGYTGVGTEPNDSGSACHNSRAELDQGKSLPTSDSVLGLHIPSDLHSRD